ncbi:MAG TPA: Gfo/Idh/MocA family oxidoreductase [Anaerolineae bacterium]
MTLTLGIFGTGVMGQRHIRGLGRLRQVGRLRFDLAGVCDLVPESAQRAVDLAEEQLGYRPALYSTFEAMQHGVGQLDAILITTSPAMHVDLGVQALQAGVNVMVEKPIALTVRQGQRLTQTAAQTGKRLAVAENYRRDPINRLARALIEVGTLGRPFLAVQSSSSAGENVIITPWRHLRHSCGIIVDMGVHYADILEYLLGPIDSLSGMNAVVDRQRRGSDGKSYPADAEDLSVGVAHFQNGALANWLLSMAGRGAGHFSRVVYGIAGSLTIPPDRTGQPLQLTLRRDGKDTPIPVSELGSLAPSFALDPATAALFGGERLTSYSLPWADIDAGLLAIEHDDFASAILDGRSPEVRGEEGLRALAMAYGFLESERLGRTVRMDELLSGAVSAYQDELE